MRDPMQTRRLLAKVSREEDVYVILDRVRQAIYDIDDFAGRLEGRIHAIEEEKREFQKASGVHRIIEETSATQTSEWSTWLVRAALGGLGAAALSLIAWVLRLAWKGLHT